MYKLYLNIRNHLHMFSLLSRYKSELMGISMIMVMIFHSVNPVINIFGFEIAPLKRAEMGVDFFLVLSAVGCYFSLSKNGNILRFYKNRIIRIIPAFIICAFTYSVVLYYTKGKPISSFWEYITMYALLKGDISFWYIGNIMVCYLAMPVLYKLSKYKLVYCIFTVIFTIFIFYLAYKQIGLNNVSLCRFPIFVVSVLIGKTIYESDRKDYVFTKRTILIQTIVALLCYISTTIIVRTPMEKHISLFIVSIPLLLWIAMCLSFTPTSIRRCLSFIGGISLEIYLLHSLIVAPILYIFIHKTIIFIICTFLVTIMLGYFMHITIRCITNAALNHDN